MNLTPETINDLTLYGGVFLFLIIAFFTIGDDKQKNRDKRLKDASHSNKKDEDSNPEQHNLRKETNKDNIPIISLLTNGEGQFITKLRTRLEIAGVKISAEKYILINIITGISIFAIISIVLQKPIALATLAGIALGLGLPHFIISRKIKSRQKNFLLIFPDAIDLIVRGLKAGLPVTQSIQNVAEEISEPVQTIFHDISEQVTLGMTFEKSLESAANKLKLTEFNFFITSIILQRETGGNLGEILNNLSEVLRSRQMMKMKIKAMSSEAKASGIIVGALPFFVFSVLNVMSPEYIEILYSDFRGNIALLAALTCLSIGAFIMAKLASFEI